MKTTKTRIISKRRLQIVAVMSLLFGVIVAAPYFIPNQQPWGYVAPPALSGINIARGNIVAYTPWFETGSYRGDLIALSIAETGKVNILGPIWRAASVLDGQDFNTGRQIFTSNGTGTAIPFRTASLTVAQQTAIESDKILNYVRGDRSNESAADLRIRNAVLGDIVHSNPVYVRKPLKGYNFDNYLTFAGNHAGRAPRVYVGANDGMLHAFDAATGAEVFAYVPSAVISNLWELAVEPYDHRYYVDGYLTVEDAQYAGVWRTFLVGGLGAGGKAYYGLDITDPDAATEAAAASKLRWEFHAGSTGATNLGYTYGRPSIARLKNGGWSAVVANGYLSNTGAASLYILDIQTGSVTREIIVPDADVNGLSSPTLVDNDDDGIAEAAYAGDLNGNLWKFDLSSSSPAAWSVAYNGNPLFKTEISGSERQAITTAPEVGRHPEGGVIVFTATGRLLSGSDALDKSVQSVYGIWDNNWSGGVPINQNQLLQQYFKAQNHVSGQTTRTATANKPNWNAHRGWVMQTEISGATSLDKGERVIQDLLLRDGRITYITVNPTISTGENWFMQVDALTGGAPSKIIVDVNDDFELNIEDNVDGNGDNLVQDVPEDRVVGQYQNFGLASRPVVGIINSRKDTALINHLTAIDPAIVVDLVDPGLIGGHFDLDTSSEIYTFGAGSTTAHSHEWDDINDSTVIDYMDIAGDTELAEITDPSNGVGADDIFMLTIANTEYSPGGVLEINSTNISVTDYHDKLNRYLTGNLFPKESFPLYKLNDPTAAEAANGVRKLITLKMTFDAFVILSGGLIPTETGCVRDNDPGALGEYRNGALLLQALDANDIGSGYAFNTSTQQWDAESSKLDGTHGYATQGLLWESSIFWHWKFGCYGEPAWDVLYDNCIVRGLGLCFNSSEEKKDKGKKKKKKKDDPPGGGGPVPGTELDPKQTVSNTTIGGTNDIGRISWKELVPQ